MYTSHTAAGFELREWLAAYPEYVRDSGRVPMPLRDRAQTWLDPAGLVARDQGAR